MIGCLACDLTAGRRPVPGGSIHRTPHWAVEHCVGPLGVGTLVVKTLRHAVHVADLTAGESAELGPLLRLAAATVTALTSPEQVYVCLWSHAGGEPGHLHFVVQPVHRGDMDGHRSYGPGLQMAMFEAGVLPDPGAVEVFAGRMRDRLAQVRTP